MQLRQPKNVVKVTPSVFAVYIHQHFWTYNYLHNLSLIQSLAHLYAMLSLHFFSIFVRNNGGLGGAVSTAYVPLSFNGINRFKANRGRSFLVSKLLIMFIHFQDICLFLLTKGSCLPYWGAWNYGIYRQWWSSSRRRSIVSCINGIPETLSRS